MNKLILTFLISLLPILSFGQVIDNFDSEPSESYWQTELSDNANSHDGGYEGDPVGFMNYSYSHVIFL